jgi:hypothetical protein
MDKWNTLAAAQTIEKTAAALKQNGIESIVVSNGEEAKKQVLEMIPKGAEVMTMTSITADTIGISKEINESGSYNALRPKLFSMDRKTQGLEMQKLGSAPEWSIGSVHAVTEEGNVVIASNSGSQLPGYVYGSQHVIWLVSTKKIVKNIDEAMKRIYDYVLPLESERAHKAYGIPGSFVSKLLIINKEVVPERITIIFINEELGF